MVIKTFAETLKSYRKEKKLSYRALAKKLNKSDAVVVYYEQGKIYPSDSVQKDLCDIFGWNRKAISLMIEKEKGPNSIKKYLSPNLYPELRSALLSFYTPCKGKYAPRSKIEDIVSVLPWHPIEKKVLSIAHTALVRIDEAASTRIPTKNWERIEPNPAMGASDCKDDPEEFFRRFNFHGKEAKLRVANFSWSYDSRTHNVIYIDKSKGSRPQETPFKVKDLLDALPK